MATSTTTVTSIATSSGSAAVSSGRYFIRIPLTCSHLTQQLSHKFGTRHQQYVSHHHASQHSHLESQEWLHHLFPPTHPVFQALMASVRLSLWQLLWTGPKDQTQPLHIRLCMCCLYKNLALLWWYTLRYHRCFLSYMAMTMGCMSP